jgi:hypothetical protein
MHILEHAIEVERLALITLQLSNAAQCPEVGLEKAFQEALPKALRLVELTEEFLKQKEAERNAYWETPEGKKEFEARRAEIKARYGK